MRLSLVGLRRHRVLLAGSAFPQLLARLAPFFDVEAASEAMLAEHGALHDRRPATSALIGVLHDRLQGRSALMDAQALPIDEALLASLPHLRAVCRIGPDDSGLDLEACTRAGVIVTNTPDLGNDERARRGMALAAADNLIAAFGFGRSGGHPANLLNTELRCTLGCCL